MTFVSYPNVFANSPSGKRSVEIVGQKADGFFRDQSNFTFRSLDSNRLVWEWKPDHAKTGPAFLDDYPHEAWISDEGWIIVRTHEWFHAGLMAIAPDGTVVTRRFIRNLTGEGDTGFLESEPEHFMGGSSAGPFWSRSSIAYFCEMQGRKCWTLRTWWGRRVVIDLLEGRFLAPGAEDANIAATLETAIVTRSLAEGVRRITTSAPNICDDVDAFWSTARPVLAAVYQAGSLKSTECVPLLREIEGIDLVGSTGYGPVRWAAVETLPFRQVAKLSLLRLGQEPKWLPHYRFKLHSNSDYSDEGALFDFPVQLQTRDYTTLAVGMDQKTALQCIGAPDYIRNDWEYDYLADGNELTARVSWDESHLPKYPTGHADREALMRFHEQYRVAVDANPPRIARLETVDPQWQQLTMRDHEVVV